MKNTPPSGRFTVRVTPLPRGFRKRWPRLERRVRTSALCTCSSTTIENARSPKETIWWEESPLPKFSSLQRASRGGTRSSPCAASRRPLPICRARMGHSSIRSRCNRTLLSLTATSYASVRSRSSIAAPCRAVRPTHSLIPPAPTPFPRNFLSLTFNPEPRQSYVGLRRDAHEILENCYSRPVGSLGVRRNSRRGLCLGLRHGTEQSAWAQVRAGWKPLRRRGRDRRTAFHRRRVRTGGAAGRSLHRQSDRVTHINDRCLWCAHHVRGQPSIQPDQPRPRLADQRRGRRGLHRQHALCGARRSWLLSWR